MARSRKALGLYQVTHKNGERFSAAKAYLTPNLSRPNLQVFTGAHTTRILLEKKRAVGVEFVHEGQLKQLKCQREVLLCAGAIQSPQILMLSGIGPHQHLLENGIATQHNLPGVGQHLHDHPDIVQVVHVPGGTDLFGLSLTGGVHTLKGIFDWRKHRTGMLTTNFAEAGGFIKSQPEEATPDLQLHFVIGKLINHGRTLSLGHGYSCHVCILRPLSRGSVQLAGKDPMALPLVDPNFLGHRDDMDRMVRGFKLMRTILANNPRWRSLAGANWPPRLAHKPTSRSNRSSAITVTQSTTRWAVAAWGLPTWMWSMHNCACTACKGCGWWMHRSCRASLAATPTHR
jgi:choline dehydrogenase-like flavoprotein